MNNNLYIDNIPTLVIIDKINAYPITIPLKRPFRNHVRKIEKIDGLVISIITKCGIEGQGIVYGLGEISHKKIMTLLEARIQGLLNKRLIHPHKFWNDILLKLFPGDELENLYTLTAIDIAIWDICLKYYNIALNQVLPHPRPNIPVYATSGWLSLSIDELIEECKVQQNLGITSFKVRIGHNNDYARIKQLRDTFGEELVLMVDANRRYTVEEAIQVACKLSELKISWLEEPISDLQDLSIVANNSPIPLAFGENILSRDEFCLLAENNSVRYIQPDIFRCRGLTGFLDICALLNTKGKLTCNHLMPELSSSIIGGFSTGYSLEHYDIFPIEAFTHDFSVKDGFLNIPLTTGTGVNLKPGFLKKYLV